MQSWFTLRVEDHVPELLLVDLVRLLFRPTAIQAVLLPHGFALGLAILSLGHIIHFKCELY